MINRSEMGSVIVQELFPGQLASMVPQEDVLQQLRRRHLGRELPYFEAVVAKKLQMDEKQTLALLHAVLDLILDPNYKKIPPQKILEE